MIDWTTIIVMSGTDDLWFDEMKEGIDGHVYDSKGKVGRTVTPLEDMIR